MIRGIRGAITVEEDRAPFVLEATKELLSEIVRVNGIQTEDIASVLFSVTPDLKSVFPAEAARQLNWKNVPLFCCQEMEVPGAMPKCIRLLAHWNTDKPQSEVKHVYMREAIKLRPDLKA